jgi:hypothetical protein
MVSKWLQERTMKTQPWESSIMLAGLTRGLWTGAPADRYPERPGILVNAAGRPASQVRIERPAGRRDIESHLTNRAASQRQHSPVPSFDRT